MILEGTTSSGAVVPVQVTGDGKVVAEGLQGPEGPQGQEGPQGPEGPPGPSGGQWQLSGTKLVPIDDLAEIETQNPIHFASLLAEYATLDGAPDGNGGRLSFSTTPSGGTTPVERMRILESGAVVMSTDATFAQEQSAKLTLRSTGSYVLACKRDGTATEGQVAFSNANGRVGTITTSGSATAYNTSSDYRLKENIVSLTGAAERLKRLKPVRFSFKVDPKKTVDGFIAHEAQEVIPEAVTGVKDEVDSQDRKSTR